MLLLKNPSCALVSSSTSLEEVELIPYKILVAPIAPLFPLFSPLIIRPYKFYSRITYANSAEASTNSEHDDWR